MSKLHFTDSVPVKHTHARTHIIPWLRISSTAIFTILSISFDIHTRYTNTSKQRSLKMMTKKWLQFNCKFHPHRFLLGRDSAPMHVLTYSSLLFLPIIISIIVTIFTCFHLQSLAGFHQYYATYNPAKGHYSELAKTYSNISSRVRFFSGSLWRLLNQSKVNVGRTPADT